MNNGFSAKIKQFLELEAASGLVLLAAALFAFAWANTETRAIYFQLVHWPVLGGTLAHWINDALMVLFFFVVGMEIKRELAVGELSSREKALLPVLGACGGALVPALIYLFLNPGGEAHAGWGIPMATDIAFAVGVLSLFGNRIPAPLKIFLLALAIVDDLIAILVIAFFYTANLSWLWLGIACAVFGLIHLLQRLGVRPYAVYVLCGIAAWFAIFQSGVHATIAGVVLGLLTPLRIPGRAPLDELVHFLHPWVSFGIMPLFAFFNAGVDMSGVDGFSSLAHPVFYGIFFGLLIGKPLGIVGIAWLSTALGAARLPNGVSWRQMLTVGFLGGVGFTMALFVQELALRTESLHVFAKTGILLASLASAGVGALWTLATSRRRA